MRHTGTHTIAFIACAILATAAGGCSVFCAVTGGDRHPQYQPPLREVPAAAAVAPVADTAAAAGLLSPYPPMRGAWVDSVLEGLSLRDRIAQMVVPFSYSSVSGSARSELLSLVRDERVGGVIISLGTVGQAAALVDTLQSLAAVPLLISADFENGLAMRLRGATEFPSLMALGATGNTDLAYAMGRAVAAESRALGVGQNYTPVADVNCNPMNPIINTRSFGEDAALVGRMAEAYARGLQDGGVIATAKHFPGHGDTDVDSHSDLPLLPFTGARLDSIELAPFRRLVDAGILSVMIGHLAVPALDSAVARPATVSPVIVDSLLCTALGFHGLVVTDAMNMKALLKQYRNGSAAVRAVQAGADVVLMPTDVPGSIDALAAAVARGEITEQRIAQSARRILSYKHWLGLATRRRPLPDASPDTIACASHRALAAAVGRAAVTLVRNDSVLIRHSRRDTRHGVARRAALLPLRQGDRHRVVLLSLQAPRDTDAGERLAALLAPDIPRFSSCTVDPTLTASRARALLDSARRADILIIASYITVRSAGGSIELSGDQQALVGRIATLKKPAVLLSFGSPYVLTALPWVAACACAYGADDPSLRAAADMLFGRICPQGSLPVTIPGLAARSTRLDFCPDTAPGEDDCGETIGPDFARVDSLVLAEIRLRSFPGAQLAVYRDGRCLHARNYGALSYDAGAGAVTSSTMYDLASITKVVATTTAAMALVEDGTLDLDERVASTIPAFARNGKGDVRIRNLLLHNSGLAAFHLYYRRLATAQAVFDSICSEALEYPTGARTVYSDLGFITLGKVVERITGRTLDAFVRDRFFAPLGMHATMFRPPDSLRARCAPTEVDTYWRQRRVQGTVHDETADLLGGVSGHAGLFSTAGDLSRFAQMLLNRGEYDGKRYLKPETVDLFTRRAAGTSRTLGWDTRSAQGSSAGHWFSLRSFGHTGFTGTSIWIDPDQRMFVVFLTNRVHPTRENKRLLVFRAILHDAVRRAMSHLD